MSDEEAQKDLLRLHTQLQHARQTATNLRKELAVAFAEIERLKAALDAKVQKPRA